MEAYFLRSARRGVVTVKKAGGARFWILVWLLGLAGQVCWNLENQWFNTFVYAKIAKNPSIITGMLICSAAATTFSTFFFGTWSDRTGNRRRFISLGYILWGVFTIAFGLTQFISPGLYVLAGAMVVLADTVMSFFGSMGNDCAYNAWINDSLTDRNRGQLGASLATQPVIGTILGTVVGGMLVGKNDDYLRLFVVMGALVILFGLLSALWLGPGEDIAPSKRGTFAQQFAGVFRFRALFRRRELLLVHLAVAVFFIGFNSYFAYIGNYIIYYLGYSADQMGIIEAVPLVIAMLASIPVARLLNRDRHIPVAVCAALVNTAGLLVLWPIRPGSADTAALFSPRLFLGIFLVGAGYICFLQTGKIWAKQLYPADARGQFEGVWIVFFVLIPMIGGSLLGEAGVRAGGETFVDAVSGQTQYIPNGNIFLIGAVFILLSVVPTLLAAKEFRRRIGKGEEQ